MFAYYGCIVIACFWQNKYPSIVFETPSQIAEIFSFWTYIFISLHHKEAA